MSREEQAQLVSKALKKIASADSRLNHNVSFEGSWAQFLGNIKKLDAL